MSASVQHWWTVHLTHVAVPVSVPSILYLVLTRLSLFLFQLFWWIWAYFVVLTLIINEGSVFYFQNSKLGMYLFSL